MHPRAAQFQPSQIGDGGGSFFVACGRKHHIGRQIVKTKRNRRIDGTALVINGNKQRDFMRTVGGPSLQFIHQFFCFRQRIIPPLDKHPADFSLFYRRADQFRAVHIYKHHQGLPQLFLRGQIFKTRLRRQRQGTHKTDGQQEFFH